MLGTYDLIYRFIEFNHSIGIFPACKINLCAVHIVPCYWRYEHYHHNVKIHRETLDNKVLCRYKPYYEVEYRKVREQCRLFRICLSVSREMCDKRKCRDYRRHYNINRWIALRDKVKFKIALVLRKKHNRKPKYRPRKQIYKRCQYRIYRYGYLCGLYERRNQIQRYQHYYCAMEQTR